jgi:hypothetical protein
MDKVKNYVIAILTGLLVLSLFTQPAQSAGTSTQAKQMEYLVCLQNQEPDFRLSSETPFSIKGAIKNCLKYRP